MNTFPPKPAPAPRIQFLAAVLAALMFALGLFSVAPELHDALHHADDHETHYCAVDMFAAGVALIATAAVFRPLTQLHLGNVAPTHAVPATVRLRRYPPGRAPPPFSS